MVQGHGAWRTHGMLGTSADAASAAQLLSRCSLLVFLERRLPHAQHVRLKAAWRPCVQLEPPSCASCLAGLTDLELNVHTLREQVRSEEGEVGWPDGLLTAGLLAVARPGCCVQSHHNCFIAHAVRRQRMRRWTHLWV